MVIKKKRVILTLQPCFFLEMMLVNLITSIEVYLKDTFLETSPYIIVEDVEDKESFVTFLRRFNILDEYLNCFSKYGGNNYPISKLLPNRIDFQQKRKLKIAYRLISIDLKNITRKNVFNNIFDKKTGYIQQRHRIIHDGYAEIVNSHQNLNNKFVINAALNICQFSYELDNLIISKYPKDQYPDLYPKIVR
jgi:hypothetical protein